jgi:large subunit ribosomal protein L33
MKRSLRQATSSPLLQTPDFAGESQSSFPGLARVVARASPGLLEPTLHDSSRRPMRENIRLVSSAGTGFTYYTTKNKRTQTNKLEMKKYDPIKREHVVFKEAKMPPHSK